MLGLVFELHQLRLGEVYARDRRGAELVGTNTTLAD